MVLPTLAPYLGPRRPIVVGCGLGGWLVAELAVRYPERLAAVVLVDAYGLRVDGALSADEFALTPAMLRPLLFVDPDGPLAHDWLPGSEPQERLESSLRTRVAAVRLAWQFPYSPKLRDRLARGRLPALVIWGERDRLVPVAHALAYAESLPHARLATMPDVGHYPYLERPQTFTDDIERFAQRLDWRGKR
jgi:pimeloyl-ACP methyl ester carboxylesterase